MQSKLANMTAEELAEYERDKAAETKREMRRERMLSTQMTAYGAGVARGGSSVAALRGRGRGGRGGGAKPSAGGGFGGTQAF